jgi:4-hydroxy-4-methyl-2-oxoglutarate aldolase
MNTTLLSLIEQLREFEAPLITEGMGLMGCTDSENHYLGREIKLLTQFSTPVVGIALVLLVDTSTPGHKADMEDYWRALQIVEDSPVPQIVVMKSTGSRLQHECVLGDGMAKTFKASGSAGLITDGGIRDVRQIDRAGYPVFASGVVANHSSMLYKLSQEPVSISGISIKNRDLIHGDSDGVTIIPQQYHRGIVSACIASRDFETKVHTFWRRTDKTLVQKRAFVMQMVEERIKNFKSLMEKIED